MLMVAICDDDVAFLDRFYSLLKEKFLIYNYPTQIDVFTNGKNLVKKIERDGARYDLIFLDINMPEVHGFHVAEKLRSIDNDFSLVFTTQLQSAPGQAHKYNVFRNIDKASLEAEVDIVIKEYMANMKKVQSGHDKVSLKYITGDGDRKVVEVKKSEVIYLELVKRRVRMHTMFDEYDLQTYNLTDYLAALGENDFMIISRKYCVNLAHVIGLESKAFMLSNNEKLPIGTSYKAKKEAAIRYAKYRSLRGQVL